jgi:hypothetical protein
MVDLHLDLDDKKSRHRSPSYPAVGLREAVQRVKSLYERDGRAGASPRLTAVHIGFQSAHGQAMSVVAALKKFGLIELVKDRFVPTQRALEIINLPEEDSRRIQALKDAAISPTIYRELIEKHQDTGFPSDDVLTSELVTYRGFNPNSVEAFVKDFRDTIAFAGLSEMEELKAQSIRTSKQIEQKNTIGAFTETFRDFFAKPVEKPVENLERKPVDKTPQITLRRYPMDISIPRNLKAELSITGGDLRKEDLDRLKKQLERLIDNLSDAFED